MVSMRIWNTATEVVLYYGLPKQDSVVGLETRPHLEAELTADADWLIDEIPHI